HRRARGIGGDPRSRACGEAPDSDRRACRHDPCLPDRLARHGRDLREGRSRASMTAEDYVTLLDWRRRVADLYSDVRERPPFDAPAAHARWRNGRDELFTAHPQSPLPQSERADFRGLPYCGYDPRFGRRARTPPLREERYGV